MGGDLSSQRAGGLGVTNIDLKNISLLCKWVWKLENEDGMWQEMIKVKYLRKKTLTQCRPSPAYSHFWSGIVSIKNLFYTCCERLLGDGRKMRFWEDKWLGKKPLYLMFPRLYNLTFSQDITVHTFFYKR